MVILPAPIKVRFDALPVMALPVAGLTVKTPATLPIEDAAFKVIRLLIALAPLVLEIAPIELTPAPLMPSALVIVMPPDKAKVPPLEIVTAEVPRALLLLIAKVAVLLMVVAPE
jgi:hypothetical protein